MKEKVALNAFPASDRLVKEPMSPLRAGLKFNEIVPFYNR